MKKIYEKKGRKWLNEYFDNEEYIVIKISKIGTNEEYEVLIDKEDFEKVNRFSWSVHYSKRNRITPIPAISNGGFQIHQLIMDSKGLDKIVDHINMNRFDNRKSNLRLTTHKVNSLNQDAKGYTKYGDMYCTYLHIGGKSINFGRFPTEEEAEIMFLKANMVLGYDKVRTKINEKIKKLNVSITDEDIIYVHGRITGEIKTHSDLTRGIQNEENYKLTSTKKKTKIYNCKTQTYLLTGRGYRYEEKTKSYLTRITINKKMVNIGRYKTEKEANDIFLKCCLVIGEDKLSPGILKRIEDNNVILTEEDMSNKYIIKIKHILNGEEVPKELNGRFRLEYLKYMGIVDDLRQQGKTWYFIERYLVDEGYMKSAKDETIKRYYEEYFG